jgi:hypothetical protein
MAELEKDCVVYLAAHMKIDVGLGMTYLRLLM